MAEYLPNRIMGSKFYQEPEQEAILWEDKKRSLFFGLPLSFTKYIMTASRLKVKTGFFKKREEIVNLYRITDASLTRTLGERMCGVGTVTVVSGDATTPVIKIVHVKFSEKVRDLLLQSVEADRKRAGVSTAELVGNKGPGMPPPPPKKGEEPPKPPQSAKH